MIVATNRLLKRLERLRNKADRMVMGDSVGYEYAPLIASSSFKRLCKKAMSVCIIDPLWRIVHLSAPELIAFLLEEKGYASLNVYWLKSLPKLLHELQTVVTGLEDSRKWGILDRYMWDEVNKDEEVKGMLEKIKGTLADYFPVLINEAPRVCGAIEELGTVIDVMLILCCEFIDSDEEFVVFDVISRRILESGFTQRQLELLSLAGRLPLKRNIGAEEAVVGFEDDTIKLLERLTGSSKKLEVVPIVGMAGLGKTTLAQRIYGDPYIVYFFDIRSWACVSQEYVKRDLLLDLSSTLQLRNRTYSMSDEQLGEQIYRGLKGQKYLVVLDDIWDNRAWKDLKIYFPDDRNGSRILLTSRNIDLNLEAATVVPPHMLRLRTARESWRILQMMVFKNGMCPWRLYDVGKQISSKCWGLPLAVSITAGLLRSRWTRASWKDVAESLSNYIVSDPHQYMDTLALSYNHLPPHLRPCFLYLGKFPGDCDIPVNKLIWLWVAEGFIDQIGSRTLEDMAEGYLMDLLQRSLVMVSKKGTDGQIKACHVHDLLRSFCSWKANEERFSPIIYRYGRVSSAFSPAAAAESKTYPSHGRSLEHSTQHVNFIFCCPIELGESFQVGKPFDYETYKFLRILDIESISIFSFPREVTKLVDLRYLAIQAEDGNPPASISNLIHLQTLIISSSRNIVVPRSTWDLGHLRHLYIKSGENLIEDVSSNKFPGNDCYDRVLDGLQTISAVCPSPSCLDILSRTTNLRKLGFCGPLVSTLGVLEFPNICYLNCLQRLKLSNTKIYHAAVKSCSPLMFPETLTRLTLSDTALDWNEVRTIGLLPKLEVLKLNVNACIGQRWETSDKGFANLKLLKLQDLDIVNWETSSAHFPRLQRLVVRCCLRLEGIPTSIGEILPLELIEVSWCGESTSQSARTIQKEQERNGNDFLKVITWVHRDLQRKRKRRSYE
ncbi:putative late blight resistance protein homolog R1A-10 [Cynara cardunculus var. scolymus]|uniref:Disease resistance protein n=1 Tax=Cynara cardunculus var. scolymus TaxID=59895 RepID=A0A118JWS7_CYNCS|nr:putative late blight resistance protein homolog R1A-10 [Cynara cardunculus var. scolymus]KVH96367.1 Disease resistance protein [Cynara cardunculus var. scolymus]